MGPRVYLYLYVDLSIPNSDRYVFSGGIMLIINVSPFVHCDVYTVCCVVVIYSNWMEMFVSLVAFIYQWYINHYHAGGSTNHWNIQSKYLSLLMYSGIAYYLLVASNVFSKLKYGSTIIAHQILQPSVYLVLTSVDFNILCYHLVYATLLPIAHDLVRDALWP